MFLVPSRHPTGSNIFYIKSDPPQPHFYPLPTVMLLRNDPPRCSMDPSHTALGGLSVLPPRRPQRALDTAPVSPPPCGDSTAPPPHHPHPLHVQSTSKLPGEGVSPPELLRAACPPRATAHPPHPQGLGRGCPPCTPRRGTRALRNTTDPNKPPSTCNAVGGPSCVLSSGPRAARGGQAVGDPPGGWGQDRGRAGAATSSPGRASSCHQGSAAG